MTLVDPINNTNAARCAFKEDTFQRVMRVFRKSHRVLQQTLDAQAIISEPF